MLSTQTAREIARSLPGVSEKEHFGSDGFYANKRIFATIWHEKNRVNVRLNPVQQREYLERDGEALTEIPNAWGKQGWTAIQLEFIDRGLFTEVLRAAWETSAVKFSRASVKKKSAVRKTAAGAKKTTRPKGKK